MSAFGTIFLVGPMGVGKSTIGRALAEHLGQEFCDSDHEIERRTGATIALIFAVEGEAGFRRRESAVLAELAAGPHRVVATGGGAVIAPANRALLREQGCTVYLEASPAVLWERLRRDRSRPLLQTEDPRAQVEALCRERDAFYREVADLIINTERRSPHSTARVIACGLRNLSCRL
ncbi:MAG: shikimate kinase [Acidiferrobacter sp.]